MALALRRDEQESVAVAYRGLLLAPLPLDEPADVVCLHDIGGRLVLTFHAAGGWWWCLEDGAGEIHGPFATQDDALEDAADPPSECADCGQPECVYDPELEAKLDDMRERGNG